MAVQSRAEPKFEIDIEGELKPWDRETITTEEIATLGGWDASLGVIRVNLEEGTEHELQPGEVVKVTPGIAFSKRILFKRG